MTSSKNLLIKNLIKNGYLKTPRLIDAFYKVDRVDFVPENLRAEAYVDMPLPIGCGQTISQPLTVAFMMELLQPEPGNIVLDVGFGSGWTTALLAEVVSNKHAALSDNNNQRKNKKGGKVYAIERIPELYEFGKKNIEKYNFIKRGVVECLCGDGTKGWPERSPFDRILAGASAREVPQSWKEQLKIGGRIVAPIEWSIWLLIKNNDKDFEESEYPGFSFVPLISDN